jgi:anti-sigma factor RsiW
MNPESKSHCESTEHLLSAFALGEATEAEKEIVNAHVASCSACREQLALLSKTAQLVAQSAPQGVELESAQRQRILDAARQAKLTASSEQRKPRTSRRILTLSLLSVAALALVESGSGSSTSRT